MPSKYLKDGEKRVMKPCSLLGRTVQNSLRVTAYRIDSETPIIQLFVSDLDEEAEVYMTDTLARDLISRLERALSILPTSK